MSAIFGVGAALVAMISWGVGDFLIQRSSRRIGSVASLFWIVLGGSVVLLPFAWSRIPYIFGDISALGLLVATGLVTWVMALANFNALKRGNISIIEPIMSLELLFTVFLGVVFLHELLSGRQWTLAFGVFIGILLTVIVLHPRQWLKHKPAGRIIEAGVWMGLAAAILLALTNILTALSARHVQAVVAMWGINVVVLIVTGATMLWRGTIADLWSGMRNNPSLILSEVVFDNIAWLAFAFAGAALPVGLAVAITESYVVIASLLGVLVNHERLQFHQYAGAVLTIGCVIALAVISS